MKKGESAGRQASPHLLWRREEGAPVLNGTERRGHHADSPEGNPGERSQRSGALSGLEWKNCASGVGSKTGTGWKPAVVSP